jgi:hypothetical protein
MDVGDVIYEILRTGAVLHPRTVLVQEGKVVRSFPPTMPHAASICAKCIADETGKRVIVYEVDMRLPAPPAIGSQVYPPGLGWMEICRYSRTLTTEALEPEEPLQVADALCVGVDESEAESEDEVLTPGSERRDHGA